MVLARFHPAVRRWFERTFDAPTAAQNGGWAAIGSGRHTLIAAPTGSGKTLAAFLSSIDGLVRSGLDGGLDDRTQVVYVSPLKALSNDVRKNLCIPLEGIALELAGDGVAAPEIRTAVRTGDTTPNERARMLRRPPHILVTTPESLYILLTSDGGRAMLGSTHTVIVDEIHALADDKRGAHLALTLERLEALVEGPLLRIGLSATQKPLADVAAFLVGAGNVDEAGVARCEVVDAVGAREFDLDIEMPDSPLEALMAGEVWDEVYDQLAARVQEHRTTLIFVNTRRMAERLAKHLGERLGEDEVTSHHGSLSKEQRLAAENRLKNGELRALVATASLELGIDIGAIDLVVQMGSPRSINALLQRVGRASHHVGGVPKGRIFPLSRDDLVEAVAAVRAARSGELDRLLIPEQPIDILAQQIVACAATNEWTEQELYDLVRRAYPYRNLDRSTFDETIDMLAEGFTTRRGKRGRYLHLDAVNRRIRGRKGARLTAITCGGAIPDTFEFKVVQEPQGIQVGTLDEDFSVESLPGDIFQLGNMSWRILRVETGIVRVEDARGQPPNLPFWFGEAPGRTRELSEAVSALRADVESRVAAAIAAGTDPADAAASAAEWIAREAGVGEVAAHAVAEYLTAARMALGAMPTRDTLVMERFFDEAGDMHLVVHSPFGTRVNRAWGLTLRKVFCRTFNFELQAAATDDALVLSLGPTHSFPLEEVFQYLKPGAVRDKLVQALLDAPIFPVRWRWNATRSLALKRFVSGKRLAPHLQRMDAEDLLAVIFPDSLACFENIEGQREVPDHPLVEQTIRDCLEEAMDFEEFEELLGAMAVGDKTLIARDVREPSPLAHEILSARPYAFLDDAPAEERRTLAVQTRRRLDPASADDLSALDADAIARVRAQAWPTAETVDEAHDALLLHGFLAADEVAGADDDWLTLLENLATQRRAARLRIGDREAWVAAERVEWFAAALHANGVTDWDLEPAIEAPDRATRRQLEAGDALMEIVRGRLLALGPVSAAVLGSPIALTATQVEPALLALESQGAVFRGRFSPGVRGAEWCDRRLLARIHRYTLNRLRAEIEPVRLRDFMRFLFAWQRVAAGERAEGPDSLLSTIEQLEGFSAPAGAWEAEILPARLREYDPVWLDTLCLGGRVAWGRLGVDRSPRERSRTGPIRSTPIALLTRARVPVWNELVTGPDLDALPLGGGARSVLDALGECGASFFADLAAATGLLESQLEDALGELVSWGLVTADSFTGLRALLVPSSRRKPRRGGSGRARTAVFGMDNAGRWALVRDPQTPAVAPPGSQFSERAIQTAAAVLLRRYGVVFRRLAARESAMPPWRLLIREFFRLEARGEVRGGRFVGGVQGEQFALPGAVAQLRQVRRSTASDTDLVSISAADPLNLTGVILAGDRVAALIDNRILFRAGIPIAVREGGDVRFLEAVEPREQWDLERALETRRAPVKLRAYLGRPA